MTVSVFSRRWYFVQLLCAALGAGTSLYLLVQHTRLKSGIQGGSTLCNLGAYADCNVVNASQYAEVFGIPLAALGVLYFVFLFLLGVAQPPPSRGFRRSQVWVARAATFAVAVDVWLLGVQAFALRSFCLFCCFTYLCTVVHLVGNWIQRDSDSRGWKAFLNAERKVRLPPFVWAGTFVVLLVAAFSMFHYVYSSEGAARAANQDQARRVFMETWDQRPGKTIELKSTDPIWGNPDAKVKVVVFSDFECPHCQRAAFALHTALAPEQNQVQMVFKHFPLDMACNPLLQQPMHANACALAALGYCANQKKKFWDFHDRVFFKLSARDLNGDRDALYNGVKNLFSRRDFDECLRDPAAVESIRADIEQGRQLEVISTPTVFINGKRVAFAPTVDLIRDLVRREIAKP